MGNIAAVRVRPRAEGPAPQTQLRWVRRIGYGLLGVQLAGFLVWSTVIANRFALTFDFANIHQAWYLIAHGDLDPYSTLEGFPIWRDHSAFVLWALAPLYWLWPHAVTMLWAQDFCVVGAELVAFSWMCDLAGHRREGRDATVLAALGLLLLAANPWIVWAVSFDAHSEAYAILFVVLLARDFASGRRRAWIWVPLLLMCGDVTGTYLAGIGLGGVLACRWTRRAGAIMACLGAAFTLTITLLHANVGSGQGLQVYGYLAGAGQHHPPLGLPALVKGIATHPLNVLRTLWEKRVDVVANLTPSGLIGLASPLIFPLMAVVVLANMLFVGMYFAYPIFQYLPVYVLLPVGTISVLCWIARRHRRAALVLAGLLAAQAVFWAAIWAPQTRSQWLRVSPLAAATLANVAARIPVSAEVVASQGVVGRFSGRADVRDMTVSRQIPIPIDRAEVWFIITPMQGIEGQSTSSAMALAGELADELHAALIAHAHGVWAFRWRPPPGLHSLIPPSGLTALPAWAAPFAQGTVGRPVTSGQPGTWHVMSAGRRGYVCDELAWQQPPGRYQALVSLSATGPVNVEVWNDTGHVLLARQSLPRTNGVESVVLPVDATTAYRARLYSGWGPFRVHFIPPPPGNRLEVRVWSPGSGTVNVYSAELLGGRQSGFSS